jgi:hypothetical protein
VVVEVDEPVVPPLADVVVEVLLLPPDEPSLLPPEEPPPPGVTTVVFDFSTVFSAGAEPPPLLGVSMRCSHAAKRETMAKAEMSFFMELVGCLKIHSEIAADLSVAPVQLTGKTILRRAPETAWHPVNTMLFSMTRLLSFTDIVIADHSIFAQGKHLRRMLTISGNVLVRAAKLVFDVAFAQLPP